jgi:hypothetical protein
VPEGFVTDFASIPRLFWSLLPPDDYQYTAASIVHDRLYETHEMTRPEADKVFYRAMAIYHTPKWKRVIMYLAVRLFGRSAYMTGPKRQEHRMRVYEAAQRNKVKGKLVPGHLRLVAKSRKKK